MKQQLFAVTLLAGLLGPAQATVLDFDHLTTPGHLSDRGFSTQGFQFSYNMLAIDVSSTGNLWATGVNGGHSGKYAALNNWHGNMVITQVHGDTFSVQDLWINAWQGKAMTSTVQGWLGGKLVDAVDVSYGTPWQNVALGFDKVDQLVIVAQDSTSAFLIDDLQVNAVPEPASLALFGLAAGALALARRRKA